MPWVASWQLRLKEHGLFEIPQVAHITELIQHEIHRDGQSPVGTVFPGVVGQAGEHQRE